MTLGLVFGAVSTVALIAALVVVLLLRRQLRALLVDLCGTTERADFWAAVSKIWIVLLTLLSGTATLGYWSLDGSIDLFGGITSQLRLLLVGVLGAVLTVAFVLLRAIQQRNAADRLAEWRASAPVAAPPGWAAPQQ